MNPRKRITVALAGLILLVIIGWFVRGYAGGEQSRPGNSAASVAAVTSGPVHHSNDAVVDFDG